MAASPVAMLNGTVPDLKLGELLLLPSLFAVKPSYHALLPVYALSGMQLPAPFCTVSLTSFDISGPKGAGTEPRCSVSQLTTSIHGLLRNALLVVMRWLTLGSSNRSRIPTSSREKDCG